MYLIVLQKKAIFYIITELIVLMYTVCLLLTEQNRMQNYICKLHGFLGSVENCIKLHN